MMWRLINCKGRERKRSWFNLMYYIYYPRICRQGLRKTTKTSAYPVSGPKFEPGISPIRSFFLFLFFFCFISSFRFIICFCSLHSWKYAHQTALTAQQNIGGQAQTYPCLKRNSIPWPQYPSGQDCVATVVGTIRRVLVLACFHRQTKLTHAVGGFLRFDKEP
jgi:hypothetical protein